MVLISILFQIDLTGDESEEYSLMSSCVALFSMSISVHGFIEIKARRTVISKSPKLGFISGLALNTGIGLAVWYQTLSSSFRQENGRAPDSHRILSLHNC